MVALTAPACASVVNGSFEQGPTDPGNHFIRGVEPTGWSMIPGLETPDIILPGYTQGGPPFMVLLGPENGSRFLDMNGAGPQGALYRDVTGYLAGQTVTMTYYTGRWAQNSSGTLTASLIDPATMAVLNTQVTIIPLDMTVTSSTWEQMTLTAVVPVSGDLRLEFIGNSEPFGQAALGLDNVSLAGAMSPVPLPASAPLFGAALIALGAGGYGLKWKSKAVAAA